MTAECLSAFVKITKRTVLYCMSDSMTLFAQYTAFCPYIINVQLSQHQLDLLPLSKAVYTCLEGAPVHNFMWTCNILLWYIGWDWLWYTGWDWWSFLACTKVDEWSRGLYCYQSGMYLWVNAFGKLWLPLTKWVLSHLCVSMDHVSCAHVDKFDNSQLACVCVCMCVCDRERDRAVPYDGCTNVFINVFIHITVSISFSTTFEANWAIIEETNMSFCSYISVCM